MTGIFNARILASIAMLVFVGAAVASSTGAFFSDTETSTGNTFTAGSLDLRIDSEAHYNGSICTNTGSPEVPNYVWVGGEGYPVGLPCFGTWAESDLDDSLFFRFFVLEDIKPGDNGENTISLHVLDNDAWGRFTVTGIEDLDNTCTEPEGETENAPGCTPEGELAQSIEFNAWLDQGTVAGFQCNNELAVPTVGPCAADPAEGNNIQDATPLEVLFWTGETVDEVAEGPFELADVLTAAYDVGACTDTDGDTDYGECHGLAEDGRMVGSTTYYFGLGWSVPGTVGNEAQTDSLEADLTFEIEQHRNNPNPWTI